MANDRINNEDTTPKQIYCHCEPGVFPSEQFLKNENSELVIPYIHAYNVEYKHYTTGVVYSPSEFVLSSASQENKRVLLSLIPQIGMFVGETQTPVIVQIIEIISRKFSERFTKKK